MQLRKSIIGFMTLYSTMKSIRSEDKNLQLWKSSQPEGKRAIDLIVTNMKIL
jgi:hypothetical protein